MLNALPAEKVSYKTRMKCCNGVKHMKSFDDDDDGMDDDSDDE